MKETKRERITTIIYNISDLIEKDLYNLDKEMLSDLTQLQNKLLDLNQKEVV